MKQHPRHDVLHARGEPREQLVVLAERVAHRRLADGAPMAWHRERRGSRTSRDCCCGLCAGAPVAERVVLRVDAERVGELFVGD